MIEQEIITVGTRELRRTYSKNNKMIMQVETSIEYSEAIDPIDSTYTYVELDISIPTPDEFQAEIETFNNDINTSTSEQE